MGHLGCEQRSPIVRSLEQLYTTCRRGTVPRKTSARAVRGLVGVMWERSQIRRS